MLSLNVPHLKRLFHAPQIGAGTVDFFPFPLPIESLDAQTASGTGPEAQTARTARPQATGIGFAWQRPDAQENELDELLVFFQGNPSVGELGPGLMNDGVVLARPPDQSFLSEDAFRDQVIALRAQIGHPMPCIESHGVRNGDLRVDLGDHSARGIATWEIFGLDDGGTGVSLGAGLLLQTGPASSEQHWVLFGLRPFSRLRLRRRENTYPTLGSFLSAMEAERQRWGSSPHAIERAVHHADLPWHSAPGGTP